MRLVCLDLEGVLVPEIWIEFSNVTGIKELERTTRDEPNYDTLMQYRLEILKNNGLKLLDIQNVISTMKPLPGALDFVNAIKTKTQLVVLSDTFTQFARPLMEQLGYPTLFCNELIVDEKDFITGYKLRQKDGKLKAIQAFKSMNLKIFAAGDSFNDVTMIMGADKGVFFRAPESIKKAHPSISSCDSYQDLELAIDDFLFAK